MSCTADDGVLRIEFAAPGQRCRKVVSRSNMRPTGRFPSIRLGRMVHWDSAHELNAFRLLDVDAAVVDYAEQPCIVHYRLDGVDHRHVPDAWIRTAGGQTLLEVKTASNARRDDVATRTRLLVERLPAFGYRYEMALAEDLGRQPRLRNACMLLRHGRRAVTFAEREHARRLLAIQPRLRWQDVVDGHHTLLSLATACRLVIEGQLHLDLDHPLDAAALLSASALGVEAQLAS